MLCGRRKGDAAAWWFLWWLDHVETCWPIQRNSREQVLVNSAPTQIVWFKRDLRLADHEPLLSAAAQGPVVPLYIVEPDYWKLADSSRRHWHFVFDCLTDLQDELRECGLNLIVRVGTATEVLEELRQKLGSIALWSHEETGNAWTYVRDKAVTSWCKSHNIKWQQSPTNGVVRRLENRDGWSEIRNRRMAKAIAEQPTAIVAAKGIISQIIPAKDHPKRAGAKKAYVSCIPF
jgi:deoxyribodipyrimidine photo-lyase